MIRAVTLVDSLQWWRCLVCK